MTTIFAFIGWILAWALCIVGIIGCVNFIQKRNIPTAIICGALGLFCGYLIITM